MTTDIPSEIVEAVFRTTKVTGCKGVFNLSPQGSRVGIYFQQRRALILGWALAKEYGVEALKGKDIAIVGGGVSGMTLFKALRKLGLQKTRIYEKADRLLGHYNDTEARLVHPNYNRWPMLDEPLSFTKLPVLNWYAGTAASVLVRIKEQFEIKHGNTDAYDGVKFSQACNEIINSTDTSTCELRFEGTHEPETADIVVIATGFGGDNKTDLGFSGYWDKDVSEVFDPGKRHLRPAEIFGTGDGALIDAFQCCALLPKESHKVALGVIGRLREGDAIVLPGPKGATLRSNVYSELEKEIRHHELDSRALVWKLLEHNKEPDAQSKYDELMQSEHQFYMDFVRRLVHDWPSIKKYLDQHLKDVPTKTNCTRIIGVRPTAFEPTSAPINKILLAYLMLTDRVTYEQVTKDESEKLIKDAAARLATGDSSRITICRVGAPSNFPDTISLKVTSKGSAPKSIKFTSEEKLVFSVLSSTTGGDFVPVDSFPDVWGRAGGHTGDDLQYAVVADSMGLIRKYAREFFQGDIVWDRDSNPRQMSLRTNLTPNELLDRAREVGGIDRQFFGIPLHHGREPEVQEGAF